jgi:hypothetical protein
MFTPLDLIPVEAIGTEFPRLCHACKNCKECQVRMDSLSFKENTESEIILIRLQLDENRKKWVTAYP